MSILYDFIFLFFALVYLPYFLLTKKFHKDIWQRFGFYPKEIEAGLSSKDSIWIHAVSVGEIVAIRPFCEKLRKEFPSLTIVVSTITKTGNELAKKFSKAQEIVFYLPLDFSFMINRILRKIRPRALMIAETEIWPNLINGCYKKNIPIILVNGRISDRALGRYRLARPVLKSTLEKISIFCVRTEEDRRRFIFIGAPSKNVRQVGNMKYDIKDYTDLNKDYTDLKIKLGIRERKKIFVAGSTHKGEEEIVLGVFKKLLREFQDLYLIIAPRHVERAGEIRRLVNGLPVTVIDKIGVLQEVYSISDIVFVGGSLSQHGGHNIIEPAIFGKPILFGPHMFNFKDVADEFLRNEAAIIVKDKEELEINCRRLLSDENQRERLGENAKRVVLSNQGAVEKCFFEVKRILGNV